MKYEPESKPGMQLASGPPEPEPEPEPQQGPETAAEITLGQMLALQGVMILVAYGLAKLFGLELLALLPLSQEIVLRGFMVTAPLVIFVGLIWNVRWKPLVEVRWLVEMLVQGPLAQIGWGGLALISIMAGVSEELLFRAALQVGLSPYLGMFLSLLVASLVFGLCHKISWLYFFIATLIGLYFGIVVWHYGEVTSSIIAHGLYDWILLWWVRTSCLSGSV